MKKYDFTCPHCKKSYKISYYHLGFSDVCELRCDSCSRTLSLDIYSPQLHRLFDKYGTTYSKQFFSELEEMLNDCKCGGKFKSDAPYRCKLCNKELELAEIKRQMNWWGSEDGRLGLIITGKMSVKNIWR